MPKNKDVKQADLDARIVEAKEARDKVSRERVARHDAARKLLPEAQNRGEPEIEGSTFHDEIARMQQPHIPIKDQVRAALPPMTDTEDLKAMPDKRDPANAPQSVTERQTYVDDHLDGGVSLTSEVQRGGTHPAGNPEAEALSRRWSDAIEEVKKRMEGYEDNLASGDQEAMEKYTEEQRRVAAFERLKRNGVIAREEEVMKSIDNSFASEQPTPPMNEQVASGKMRFKFADLEEVSRSKKPWPKLPKFAKGGTIPSPQDRDPNTPELPRRKKPTIKSLWHTAINAINDNPFTILWTILTVAGVFLTFPVQLSSVGWMMLLVSAVWAVKAFAEEVRGGE